MTRILLVVVFVGWPLFALLSWIAGMPSAITAILAGQAIGYLLIYAIHPGGLRLDFRRWRR